MTVRLGEEPNVATLSAAVRRVRIAVHGTVQGVGFRPYVFRLARSLSLAGFVRNDVAGVAIEVQGAPTAVASFLAQLATDAPPHASIGRLTVTDVEPRAAARPFAIEGSVLGGTTSASIPADLCTCGDCLRELFDRRNRRYRYPFINCTACGPRFTIARGLPYDRQTTTMAAFTMCRTCQAEYDDPADRRFHAQPNACAECGPRVSLLDGRGARQEHAPARDVVERAARALNDGAIVAVKGLGGYHLACRADDSAGVTRLRARKQRDDKPFAIMVRSVGEARRLVVLDGREARLLASAARPILLARARMDARIPIAPAVAPGRRELGVMLPYTPLHHLLLGGVDAPLVMTSGNLSDEPIVYRDDEALVRLAPIADFFLTHDRPIETRCDDSVVRVVDIARRRQTLFIRRSRGYVPQPLPLPLPLTAASRTTPATVLAVGGQLKNTTCIARAHEAVVGAHAGDIADAAAFAAYVRGIEHLTQLSGMTPVVVAHDLHPEYLTTKYARDRTDLTPIAVQHHHAHLAACLAEHGERGRAVGVIFDGAGYGEDGVIWGGEILLGHIGSSSRLGHLRPVAMPGGEAAIREPWRMACAWLTDAHAGAPQLGGRLRTAGGITDAQWSAVSRLARAGSSAPRTTSVGRLLDACAAICGIRARVTFEGQAAIELESIANRASANLYPVAVCADGASIVLDPRDLVLAVERDVNAGLDPAEISAGIHRGLVYAATSAVQLASERSGVRTVVLSGGVFQNVFLLETLAADLARRGFRVLVPQRLPPNDGGLAYGQVAVALWSGRRRSDVSGDTRTDY